MPSPDVILAAAGSIANEWRTTAAGWHLFLGIFLLALVAGWRPTNRVAGCLIALPFLSVGALAWVSANPFNGTVFLAFALTLFAVSNRLWKEPVRIGPPAALAAGASLVAFGWVYPHFLATDSWTAYAYASPFGLLPCPTLAAAIGLTLILGLLRSTPWSAVVAGVGVVYGVIGVFRLGVALDYGLLAGALALAAAAYAHRRSATGPPLPKTRAVSAGT